ncbi:transcription factor Maf-like [Rhipicephalus sanguineus]|uniref:transcription factor Maf-like n=1 Tax=Rhipicephalus sanguineus TaxID=34632 RepID=UPI0020C4AE84|nr:transcription factor Maf-like [Rhipicephalus sanguineus]
MKAALVLAVLFVIANADHHEGHEGHHGNHTDEHGHHHGHHHGHEHGHEQGHEHGHPSHHGSVCSFPEEALATVVECVERNITDEVRGKLTAVSQRLECETILCGIKKFCQAHGTLEGNRTDVFTHEENVELRNAFIGCKPQPLATTESVVEHVSEAAAEA